MIIWPLFNDLPYLTEMAGRKIIRKIATLLYSIKYVQLVLRTLICRMYISLQNFNKMYKKQEKKQMYKTNKQIRPTEFVSQIAQQYSISKTFASITIQTHL